ncbi:hypothetical protein [Mucilaginibacter sp. NFR10]|uniref:hypothetical protein n=1 Tax=Mucilaginibacter sp. NFR10 TaxID=1566292 RepID=UPI0008715016|nr:hypothetical protein [Mucilaginibacter sp. NFR10]SCW88821.1 hypothetical protein SAMN03159284_05444 [Mucilaginibacter sp. NFR10]
MKNLKMILIEDDSKKIDDIRIYVTTKLKFPDFTVKESYQSGVKEILTNDYDLLLLDMSIPTFDKTPFESGGHYEKFGGYKVLKEIVRKKRPIKTILITMFDDFGESDISITLSQIDQSLAEQFAGLYLGSVFYNARENKWQEDLKRIIEEV